MNPTIEYVALSGPGGLLDVYWRPDEKYQRVKDLIVLPLVAVWAIPVGWWLASLIYIIHRGWRFMR